MEKVKAQFEHAVEAGQTGVLNSPGHEGMVIFFNGLGYTFDAHDIRTVYTKNGWDSKKSLTLNDVRQSAR